MLDYVNLVGLPDEVFCLFSDRFQTFLWNFVLPKDNHSKIMAQNELFPIFLKLNTLDVLLVGGGNVGLEKISAMLQNSPEARITVVAPMILVSLWEYIRHFEQVQIIEREFQEQDLDNRDLVILATDNPQLHATIKATTKQRRILCNVADTPHLCDFYLGSIVQKGDLKIAISTNGKSPTLAKRMRQYLEHALPDNTQELINNLTNIRNKLKGDFKFKVEALNNVTKILSNSDDEYLQN